MEQQNQQLNTNNQLPNQQAVEQSPTPSGPSNHVPTDLGLDKAWKKIKVAAILLISTSSLGLVLMPFVYTNYAAELSGANALQWHSILIISIIIQIAVLILGIKLLNKNRVLSLSFSLKQRLLIVALIGLSFLFVSSVLRFVNVIACGLLVFAFADIRAREKQPPLTR